MALLSRGEIRKRLASLRGWKAAGRSIVKGYVFRTYLDGIAFVNRVARLAEKQNHHPDITVGWRRVQLTLTTHDEGGLTERDFRLARLIAGWRG